MIEFDKWNKYNLGYTGKQAFEAGQQSQQAKIDKLLEKHSEEKRILHNVIEMNQAKIDELQAKYDELNNRATGIALDQMTTAKLNYELQGRIDEALRRVVDHGGYDGLTHVISILKGNKNEKTIRIN